jgi:hypothetical protein
MACFWNPHHHCHRHVGCVSVSPAPHRTPCASASLRGGCGGLHCRNLARANTQADGPLHARSACRRTRRTSVAAGRLTPKLRRSMRAVQLLSRPLSVASGVLDAYQHLSVPGEGIDGVEPGLGRPWSADVDDRRGYFSLSSCSSADGMNSRTIIRRSGSAGNGGFSAFRG